MFFDRLVESNILISFALAIICFAAWRVNRTLRSPLAHLPGPQISKWTNLRLKYAVLRGDRARYIHYLHEIYGPIVRTSPTEVSIADVSVARQVYKVGGPYLKTKWYDQFTGRTVRSMFQIRDPYTHGQLRKLASAHFSERYVATLEPTIIKKVKLAVLRMEEEVKSQGYSDAFKWFTFMATDLIGELSFGESFRMLETGKKNQYIFDLEKIGEFGNIRAELSWFAALLGCLPFGPAKELPQALIRMDGYTEESLERYYSILRSDPDHVPPTLLTKMYKAVEDGTIPMAQMHREAAGYIVAGTDTTAEAATWAVWLLSQHPDIEKALIEEVATLPYNFNDEDLRALKLLGPVLNETLRLRSPVSQGLPRSVPSGGAELCGYFLPEDTTVSLQAWSMHRDPHVWPHPERFEPARWNEPTKEMLHSFVPFGGGSRICIGMHLAQMELRHALANFYRTFNCGMKPSRAHGFSEADMVPMFYFLTPPKGKRCLLQCREEKTA
ncbi:hypothetical protein M433DRAFT_165487 [Acidomyces richmondensis BFW]|nr:MAG: hypothetical protein FE78DRAFT_39383 [Acidomyces sp. 'richmondensis']KYG46162.1 hypothetical protein M433DRAFT_165487 [Acidomyces richmondensis BFW]